MRVEAYDKRRSIAPGLARLKCSPDQLEQVVIAGRKLEVAPPTIDSWNALSTVLGKHGYVVRKDDTGSYNCRNIGDTNTPSLHSYGIAVDVNWNTNPYKKTPDRRKVRYSAAGTQDARAAEVHAGIADTDMTRDMINDVLAIKTTRGERVFDWGGRWETIKDTMHFELDLGPEELAAGIEWSSVAGHVGPAIAAPSATSPASVDSPQGGASGVYGTPPPATDFGYAPVMARTSRSSAFWPSTAWSRNSSVMANGRSST